MAKKLISLDDAQPAGSRLPAAVRTDLNATYAPTARIDPLAPRRAPSMASAGDSNVAIGTDAAARSFGQSFASLVPWLSKGRILFAGNFGVPSDTVQMIAARIPQVIAVRPGTCLVLAGSNSTTKGYSHFNDARAVYETGIIQPLLDAGIEPILCTIPPRDNARTNATNTNTGPAVYQLTLAWNVFVRSMAAKYRLTVVDLYKAVTDPATGNFKAGYTGDGVHWGYDGVYAVSRAILDTILPLFPAVTVPLSKDRYDLVNMASSPLFLDGVGSGTEGRFPPGWNGSGSANLATVSIIDPTEGDGLEAGKWLRLIKTGSNSANVNMIKTLASFAASSGVAVNVGDRIGLGFRYRIGDLADDGYVTVSMNFRGSGGTTIKACTPMNQYRRASEGVVWYEETVPEGCIDIRFDVSFSTAGASRIDLGQVSLYDLTSMGMPTLLSTGAVAPAAAAMVAPPEYSGPPAQVTGLTAGTPAETSQPLSWTAVSGATSYKTQYRTSPSGTWTDGPTATGTSATVTGLTASTAYDYRVAAVNSAGTGTYSATVTVTTAAAGSTPAMVMVTSDTASTDTAVGTLGTTDAGLGGTAGYTYSPASQMQKTGGAIIGNVTTTRYSTIDLTKTAGRVKLTATASSGAVPGIVLGATSDVGVPDCYVVSPSSSGQVLLNRIVGGASTTIHTSAAGVVKSGDVLEAERAADGTMKVWINGTLLTTQVDNTVSGGTRFGVKSPFTGSTWSIDNVEYYAPA